MQCSAVSGCLYMFFLKFATGCFSLLIRPSADLMWGKQTFYSFLFLSFKLKLILLFFFIYLITFLFKALFNQEIK